MFDAFTCQTDLPDTTGFELPFLVFVASCEHAALACRGFGFAGAVDAGAFGTHLEIAAGSFLDFAAFTGQTRGLTVALRVIGFIAFGFVFIAYPKIRITSGFACNTVDRAFDAFLACIPYTFGVIGFVALWFGGLIFDAFSTVTVQPLGAAFAHDFTTDAGEAVAFGIADGIISGIAFVLVFRVGAWRLIFDAACGFAMKSRLAFFALKLATLTCHPGIAGTIGCITVAAFGGLSVVDADAVFAGKRCTAWNIVAAFGDIAAADAYPVLADKWRRT